MDQAKERLLLALPYLRNAVAQAKQKTGRAQIAVLATNPNGSGNLIARFEADEFFADLEAVLGAAAQTEEDDLKAEALQFLQLHGLKVQD